MGQAQSIGGFRYNPDEWEQERSTGNYRPRRRSADARPFTRPRTPLQFGTVPTALPVNPADYVDTTIRRRAIDLDDWDAKLGTEEYVPAEHANIVGVDPVEEAQRAEQRYEEYLNSIFPDRKEWQKIQESAVGKSSTSTRHVRTEASAAKVKTSSEPSQSPDEPVNRESKKHRLERSSSESITARPPPRTDPPLTTMSYENILDKAFPKRKAQMQQRHQRQQQQMLKLPDPPKPPAYRNPNVKPNIRRSASATLLLDTKKRSASLPSPAVGHSSNFQPAIASSGSTENHKTQCQLSKCSRDLANSKLHGPPVTGINPSNRETESRRSTSNSGPSPGRITVDMHLRMCIDFPVSESSPQQTPMAHSVLQTSPLSHQNRSREQPSGPRYTHEQCSPHSHQQTPSSQQNLQPGVPTTIPAKNYFAFQSPYHLPQPYHHQQHQQRQRPQTRQEQPFQLTYPTSLHQLSWAELQQLQQQHAAFARAHLTPLQTRYGSSSTSSSEYTVSPGPNTFGTFAVPQYGQRQQQYPQQVFLAGGNVPNVDSQRDEEDDEDDAEEEEEEDDEEDPYHDKRYGGA